MTEYLQWTEIMIKSDEECSEELAFTDPILLGYTLYNPSTMICASAPVSICYFFCRVIF